MSPNKVNRQRGLIGKSASASAETAIIRRVTTSEDRLCGELLLGIPNEVTLDFIAPFLPWSKCQGLSTECPDWQRVFEGRMVYDARVSSQSTETFFVVLSWTFTSRRDNTLTLGKRPDPVFRSENKSTLSMFSLREELWYTLAPLPGCDSGMPSDCNHVFLDGSMYLLGVNASKENDAFSAQVYVLDLAGHLLEWRRCANMQIPRRGYVVGVMQGKIFVFGGESEGKILEVRNEVCDPKVDTWSWIAPIIPKVVLCDVFSIGEEFFVCKGLIMFAPPTGWGPESDDEADIPGDTKLVVTVGAGGPKLIRTSDDDAQDDMDCLHEIIQNQLVNREKGPPLAPSPAKSELAHAIKSHEIGHSVLIWAYDPIKDEWGVFENESVQTENVDIVQPSIVIDTLSYPGLYRSEYWFNHSLLGRTVNLSVGFEFQNLVLLQTVQLISFHLMRNKGLSCGPRFKFITEEH